jgi:hypothetical protein
VRNAQFGRKGTTNIWNTQGFYNKKEKNRPEERFFLSVGCPLT